MTKLNNKNISVFDIERFAIHDGPGIRTTIFFKGCPLSCKWCQNPEGMSPRRRPVWMEKECIHCQSCARLAKARYPGQVIWKDDRPWFDLSCGNFDPFIEVCPAGAIQYDSKRMSVDEILDEARKDAVFYHQDGGITISGGEPFFQADELYVLLQAAKKQGFDTAVESSFNAPWEKIEPCLEYLDHIYADCKIYDNNTHKQYTGVDNALIKQNLEKLLSSGHKDKVIIRTPLIPGITATPENISAVAGFISNIDPDVKYELLNYNPLAPAKYSLVDKQYPLPANLKRLDEDEVSRLADAAREAGIESSNLIIDA